MSTPEQQILPDLLAFSGRVGTTTGRRRTASRTLESLALIRAQQARTHRRRLLCGIALSAVLHAVLFLGNPGKPLPQRASVAAQAAEVIVPLPELELPDPIEETPELPPVNQPAERIAPSLPDPMRIALATDFVTPSAPPPVSGLIVDGGALRIPSSSLQGGAGALGLTRVFSLAELDRHPELQQAINPIYPPELLGSNITGVVVVHFVVSPQGAVLRPEVVSAPHPALGLAVVRAVEKWRFRAGMKAGRSVSTDMELPVRFNVQ